MKNKTAYELKSGKKQFFHSDFHWVSLAYDISWNSVGLNMYVVTWGLKDKKGISSSYKKQISEARKLFSLWSKLENGIDVIDPKTEYDYEIYVTISKKFTSYIETTGYKNACKLVKALLAKNFPDDTDILFHTNLWGFRMLQKEKGFTLKIIAKRKNESEN